MSTPTPMDEAVEWALRLQETSADATLFAQWQRWMAAAPIMSASSLSM